MMTQRTMWVTLGVITCALTACAGPVNRKPEPPSTTTPKGPEDPADADWANLEYYRYLQEVVEVIETDPALKAAFANATEDDIKSGKIVDGVEFHPGVRDKLNEIKRREIERLRDAMSKLIEKEEYDNIRIPDHLDHGDAENFSKDDLRKLIKKTSDDLHDLDKKRKEEFKEYEMKKKHDYQENLKHAKDSAEKKKLEEEHAAAEKKHKDHEKLKHPGSKGQLEEIWEEKDGMDKESFDMKTLFNLHDLNGDGYLEEDELDALFQYELDKVYDKDNPEDDMKERMEEEARMREHVQEEMDKDKDGLVSLDEWMAEEKEADFDNKEDWKTIDSDEDLFTDEDFANFEARFETKGVPEAVQASAHIGGQPPVNPYDSGHDSSSHAPSAAPAAAGAAVPAVNPAGGPAVPAANPAGGAAAVPSANPAH